MMELLNNPWILIVIAVASYFIFKQLPSFKLKRRLLITIMTVAIVFAVRLLLKDKFPALDEDFTFVLLIAIVGSFVGDFVEKRVKGRGGL